MKTTIIILLNFVLLHLSLYSQTLSEIINASTITNREEIINIISKQKTSDNYSILVININTPTYIGEVCTNSFLLYEFFLKENKNQNNTSNIDSCYDVFFKNLLCFNDTLILPKLNSETFFKIFKIVSKTLSFEVQENKEQFLNEFFDSSGELKDEFYKLKYELAMILNKWNLFIICSEGDVAGCSLMDLSGSYNANDFENIVYESLNKFIKNIDNPQQYEFNLNANTSINVFQLDSLQIKYNLKKINFDTKYLELNNIILQQDLLTLVFRLCAYSEGSSQKSLLIHSYYSGYYTYKYNPIIKKYIFLSENFSKL